jgi:Rrf2 family protein
MFITRESDYAVRILRELADGSKKTVQTISEEGQVPVLFAYKILKKLEKGGLVRSQRGARGGYCRARELKDITIFDVITAIDGSLLLSECMDHDFHCPLREGGKQCKVHAEFGRIQGLVLAGLKEKSLAQLF